MRWLSIKMKGRSYLDGNYRLKHRRHEIISIYGNRQGLTALRDALDSALQGRDASCRQYGIIGQAIKVSIRARSLSEETEEQRKERKGEKVL